MSILRIAAVFIALAAFPAIAQADANRYEIGVDGLSCPFCSYGIEKELSAVKGVDTLGVDIKRGVVTVRMKAGASLDEAQARKATKDAGFKMRSFTRLSGK
ncbi:MAG: heavy metal-associated domain-containing protein [Alphaproteobacteria bacterium]